MIGKPIFLDAEIALSRRKVLAAIGYETLADAKSAIENARRELCAHSEDGEAIARLEGELTRLRIESDMLEALLNTNNTHETTDHE